TLADARPEACLSILLPLGNGFSIKEDEKKVALVGGGVGIFPLLSVVEGYRDQGKEFTAYLGFRGRDSVCCLNEFAEGARLVVGTDDGSCGEKANAVELFLRDYDREKPDLILSCGPPVMERVLKEELAKRNNTVPCFVSLEERMGCGIGACLVCVCNKTNGEHARVCKDGPVFPIEEVVL
ncbi:MAG: dihydroorotate dehydrogenase electron transfer subunit, partial [Christensenellaceae bacterium]